MKVCKVDGNTVCVQSLCWASQKKTQKYQQRVSLKEVQSSSSEAEKNASDSDDEVDDSTVPEATSTGEHSRTNSRKWTVVFAECLPCVAGTHGGLCQHIFALLIALEAVDSKAELPGPDSVTSNRQIWGPRARNVEPQRVMASVVEKSKTDEERKGKAITCTLYEARGDNVRSVTAAQLQGLDASLATGCRMKGMLHIEQDQKVATEYGSCLRGSPLSYQLHPQSAQYTEKAVATVTPDAHKFPSLPMERDPLPLYSDKQKIVSTAHAQKIQQQTIGQSDNQLWKDLHRTILSASNFHKISHSQNPSPAFLSRLFDPPELGNVPAIRHGRRNEHQAAYDYVLNLKEANHPVVIRQVGLCLDTQFSYLGASPDRFVYDVGAKFHGLLEIKCPNKYFGSTPSIACADKGFCCELVDNTPKLKRDHQYFYQVQGQLAICGLDWCDFVVWYDRRRLTIERVPYDRKFWTDHLLPSLLTFYNQHAQPFLSGGNLSQVTEVSAAMANPPTPALQQPAQVQVNPSCFVCHVRDIRILRQCKACGRRYHHCCQVKDEDGKYCDECHMKMMSSSAVGP